MPYNTAMSESSPRLSKIGRKVGAPVRLSPASANYYNRGVATFAKTRLGRGRIRPMTADQYYNAGVLVSYGQTNQAAAQLGDLFNDVMGAVVPGWDQRPDWMKKIVVKPDPSKLLQAAQKVAPNAAGQIVSAAEKAGLNVFVNTPAGQVPVTPGMAQGMYQGMPFFTQAQGALGNIPGWVWAVGAGGIVVLLLSRGR